MKKSSKVLKNIEIGGAYNALSVLGGTLKDTVLRFRIAQNLKFFDEHRDTWAKERQKIIEANTEKGEDGTPKIDGDKYVWTNPDAEKDVLELDRTETEVQYVPIYLSRIYGDTEKNDTTIDYAALFPLLDWLIRDDIEEDDEESEE